MYMYMHMYMCVYIYINKRRNQNNNGDSNNNRNASTVINNQYNKPACAVNMNLCIAFPLALNSLAHSCMLLCSTISTATWFATVSFINFGHAATGRSRDKRRR